MIPVMSLATRCTACGTIFRVVQDQLRVSEGWVRCGRCAEVFDAREQLFDIDQELPPPWPTAPAPLPEADPPPPPSFELAATTDDAAVAMPPHEATTWVVPREFEQDEEPQSLAPDHDEPALPRFASSDAPLTERREPYWAETASTPEPEPQPEPELPEPDPEPEPSPPKFIDAQSDSGPDVLVDSRLAALAAEVAAHAPAPAEQAQIEASFLRQAASTARWQRPRVRFALALAALLLLSLLLLQLGLHFRNAIAALYPPSVPLLHSLCRAADCELQPWQRIDALAVENSGLTQAGSGNTYKLSMQLRNKAPYALALPWVDLSLSDASGALVARRMLKPTDFNLSQLSMKGDSEQQLHLVFGTGKHRVSGYSVEIFYP